MLTVKIEAGQITAMTS